MKTAKELVREYIAEEAFPGQEIYYRELAEKIGYTDSAVSAVLVELAREPEAPLRPGHRGGWWVVVERKEPAVDDYPLMQVLATMKDGAVFLRDAEGALWKAERM